MLEAAGIYAAFMPAGGHAYRIFTRPDPIDPRGETTPEPAGTSMFDLFLLLLGGGLILLMAGYAALCDRI